MGRSISQLASRYPLSRSTRGGERKQTGRPAGMLDLSVIDDTQRFAALDREWEDLYHNSPRATPFQSWAWLYSWWEFYGQHYQLRLVTVRDDDLLVGLVPLMLKLRGGFGRLLFIGSGLTDYNDVLARRGWESRVSEAGSGAVGRR